MVFVLQNKWKNKQTNKSKLIEYKNNNSDYKNNPKALGSLLIYLFVFLNK